MSKTPEKVLAGELSLTINGEPRTLPAGTTIAGMLEHLGIAGGKVAVERNRAIAARSRFAEETLEEGDQIEIVRFVGGG